MSINKFETYVFENAMQNDLRRQEGSGKRSFHRGRAVTDQHVVNRTTRSSFASVKVRNPISQEEPSNVRRFYFVKQ